MNVPYYMNVEEALQASADQTDKALGAILAMLAELYFEKRDIGIQLQELDPCMDEEEVAELEWRLKHLKSEEASLHRLESGLQSRLKVGSI